MTATTPSLATKYEPKTTEAKWQKYWEEHQVFKAEPHQGGEPYCIVIPPPNVTGILHMGHAFESALIDTLVRYQRMRGKNTLWLPGTDHASIAVQTILEKQLKTEGRTRHDLGREKFLEGAWRWKEKSGGRIVNQLRRLGVSVDWSRERFTMDEGLSKAVLTAFVELYEEGLIYRGKYMVNWCPASQSAVSDVEVENKEVEGHLWYFRYPLSDGIGYVEVATTRPETMLGDTAVAVNPQDERYKHLIGKKLKLPLIGREIPIIGDELVDPEFGTGCVKVTPAHDPNDFEMGKRHNLPFINIMNKDGTLNENAGSLQGQDRFEVRKNVLKRLNKYGFFVKVEDYKHTVPYSDRGKVPVEPLLSTQWFVKVRPLADRCLESLDKDNSPEFIPERWTKVYRDWLVKLKDWCISRQLWWGHQIPAWYAVSETGGEITDDTPFVVAHSEKEAQAKASLQFGENVKLKQDPDVLDTWFSSGLWPFSTLGWPEETADFKTYYPTTTLVTGFDIIFFWVARMAMMGEHFTGQMPFKSVYIHGLVRDENNKKMSKSANNGIDPLILIDKYGTDALRYTLIREVAGAGQDIRLEYDRKKDESASVEASRNFANKLWNAARFVMLNLDGKTPEQLGSPLKNIESLELSDRWILSRFHQVIGQTQEYLDSYGFGEAAKGLYEFIWGDFCDWYIELVKSRLREDTTSSSRLVAQQTLAYLLEGILKLLHPFMPHITEEIWHTLYGQNIGADGKLGSTNQQVSSASPSQAEMTLALQAYPQIPEINVVTEEEPEDLEGEIEPSSPQAETFLAEVEQIWNQIAEFLAKFPNELVNFFSRNRRPITVIVMLGVATITLEVALAFANSLNEIPVLSGILQIIGLGYTGWFIYRYLLWAGNRQELVTQVQLITNRFLLGLEDLTSTNSSLQNNLIPGIPITDGKTTLIDTELEQKFELLIGTIRTIRNLRAEADIKPGVKVTVILQTENKEERQVLEAGKSYIRDLAKVEKLLVTPVLDKQTKKIMAGVIGTVQVLIPLDGVVDIDALRAKLEKDLAKVEAETKTLTQRLSNPNFVSKAPEEVVNGARDALAEANKQGEILSNRLTRLADN